MRPRCKQCRKPITKWQRRRSQLASCGPIGHDLRTANWVIHLKCLRRRKVSREIAELIGLKETT